MWASIIETSVCDILQTELEYRQNFVIMNGIEVAVHKLGVSSMSSRHATPYHGALTNPGSAASGCDGRMLPWSHVASGSWTALSQSHVIQSTSEETNC